MLSGDNGILQKATDAKTKTERATIIENVQTDILAQQTENKGKNISKKQLVKILNKQFKEVEENTIPETVSTDNDIELTTTDDKYIINLSEIFNGKLSSENVKKVSDFLKIGDYVDYDPTKSDANKTQNVDENKLKYVSPKGTGKSHGNGSGEQTYEVTSEMKWKVLSVTDDKVEIVPENVVNKKEQGYSYDFEITGPIGYLYAEQELNEICKIYGYGYGADLNFGGTYTIGGPLDTPITRKIEGTGGRCLKVEDINKLAGITTEQDLKALNTNYGNTLSTEVNIHYPTLDTESGESASTGIIESKVNDYGYHLSEKLPSELQNPLVYEQYWLANRYITIDNDYHINKFEIRTKGGWYGGWDCLYSYSACQTNQGEPFDLTTESGRPNWIIPVVTLNANIIDISNPTDVSGQEGNAWKLK